METWRGAGDPRVASPIIYEAQRGLALRHGAGQSEGSEPLRWESRKLRPYERSRYDEHGVSCSAFGSVPAPPGVVMLAPPEVPRNAQPGKRKGRGS
jgi:hypothetical protein